MNTKIFSGTRIVAKWKFIHTRLCFSWSLNLGHSIAHVVRVLSSRSRLCMLNDIWHRNKCALICKHTFTFGVGDLMHRYHQLFQPYSLFEMSPKWHERITTRSWWILLTLYRGDIFTMWQLTVTDNITIIPFFIILLLFFLPFLSHNLSPSFLVYLPKLFFSFTI